MSHQLSDEMRRRSEQCSSCRQIYVETASHCLELGGPHVKASHIRTLLDCAEACATSANFLLRSSTLHQSSCALCAEACEACAKSCDEMRDALLMQRCAEECRRYAESCRKSWQSRWLSGGKHWSGDAQPYSRHDAMAKLRQIQRRLGDD